MLPLRLRRFEIPTKSPRIKRCGGFSLSGKCHFPAFLIVSTTWVLGCLVAVLTVVNFPVPALRPILLVPLGMVITSC